MHLYYTEDLSVILIAVAQRRVSQGCLAQIRFGYNSVFEECVPWSSSCNRCLEEKSVYNLVHVLQKNYAWQAYFVHKDTHSPANEEKWVFSFEAHMCISPIGGVHIVARALLSI